MKPLDHLVQRISQENLANQTFLDSIKADSQASRTLDSAKKDLRSPMLQQTDSPAILNQGSPPI